MQRNSMECLLMPKATNASKAALQPLNIVKCYQREALKQFAPLLAAGLPAPRGKIAQALVDNLQITKQGADVQLKLSVAPSDFPALMGE